MRVVDELPPRRVERKDWWAITRQIRDLAITHPGKWVEVDKDAPRSLAWRINGGEGQPAAMRDDPDFTYEAQNREIDDTRAVLYVRALPKEKGSD